MGKTVVQLTGDMPVTVARSKAGSRLEIAGVAKVDFPQDTEFALTLGEEAKTNGSPGTRDERRKALQARFLSGHKPPDKELAEFKDEPWTKVGKRPRPKKDWPAWEEQWKKAVGQ